LLKKATPGKKLKAFDWKMGRLVVAVKTFELFEYCQLLRLSVEDKVPKASAFNHKVRPGLTPPGDWAKDTDISRVKNGRHSHCIKFHQLFSNRFNKDLLTINEILV